MNIKKTIYNLIIYGLLFNFIATLLGDIIVLPKDFIYLLAAIIIVGFANIFAKVFLKFLTVKINFWSNFVMVVLLTTACLYIFQILMPYFKVKEMQFSGNAFDIVSIKPFTLTPIFSMVIISIYVAVGNSLLKLLKGGGSE